MNKEIKDGVYTAEEAYKILPHLKELDMKDEDGYPAKTFLIRKDI